MNKLMQHFPSALTSGLIALLVVTQTAVAQQSLPQDPSAPPEVQSMQANQQLMDQLMQASQQNIQQITQQSQQAAADAIQTTEHEADQAMQALDDASASNQAADQDDDDDTGAPAKPYSSSLPSTPGANFPPPPPQAAGGPLPPRIASAHRIMLTNAGISARLPLDSGELYADIHRRLADWGYYQLVSDPQDADLIFQLDEIDPYNGSNATPATDIYNRRPSFRIIIVDARTGVPLWTVTAPIYITGKKTFAHWIDVSEEGLVTRLKALAQQPVSAQEHAALAQYPTNHRGLAIGLLIGAPFALAVGGIFIARHMSNEFQDQMKASQDAFCQANHIPMSECLGG